jgi:hypothetical protein
MNESMRRVVVIGMTMPYQQTGSPSVGAFGRVLRSTNESDVALQISAQVPASRGRPKATASHRRRCRSCTVLHDVSNGIAAAIIKRDVEPATDLEAQLSLRTVTKRPNPGRARDHWRCGGDQRP